MLPLSTLQQGVTITINGKSYHTASCNAVFLSKQPEVPQRNPPIRYRKNIPVLFYFTGLHSDYHKPGDDFEKINYTGEAQVIRHIFSLIETSDKHKSKLAERPADQRDRGRP